MIEETMNRAERRRAEARKRTGQMDSELDVDVDASALDASEYDHNVVITFTPQKPIDLELDLDALTWADILELSRLEGSDDDEDLEAMVELIQKALPGQDVRELPLRTMGPVINGVMSAIRTVSEAKN